MVTTKAGISLRLEERADLLHSLLYESEFLDLSSLEEKTYRFGSLISEKDKVERELFVFFANRLNSQKLATL